MAYFNHAFVKCFNPSKIQLEKGLATKDLAAGQIGLVDDKTWKTVKHNDAASAEGLLYLVQGSYHNVVGGDTIGNNPGHGGYAESVKSKGINPKYITRLWSEECVVPTQSETCISVGPKCAPCRSALFLRLDVKGSAALRFLNRNAYAIGDSGGVCCEDDGDPDTQEYIDPALALATAAQMLLEDPIVKPFVAEKNAATTGGIEVTTSTGTDTYTIAQVVSGTGYTPAAIADIVDVKLCLVGAYVDTKFGNCSFDTRDFYGKEPVTLIASFLDESGDPCSNCGTTTSTPGQMGGTYGDTVLREILMTENYMQSPFNQGNRDSARIREIEGSDRILASVQRNDANGNPVMYKAYYLLHSVPRFNNPTGVFDNDQYLYKVYVPCDGAELSEQLNKYVAEIWGGISAASGVELESFPVTAGSGSESGGEEEVPGEGPGEEIPG